jgi:capsular exopolysaccharide synthesis family protein
VGARYLAAIRANWPLVAITVVVGVVTAGLYAALAPKRYVAKADLFVSAIDPSDKTFLGIGVLRESPSDPNRAVITAARLVKTQQVAEAVRQRLAAVNDTESTSALLKKVQAQPVGQANIVAISASGPSAKRAAAIANAFAAETIAQRTAVFEQQLKSVIRELTARLDAIPASQRTGFEGSGIRARLGALVPLVGQRDPTLMFLTRAPPPTAPEWPRPLLSIVVAFIATALLGTGIAVARELASPRLTEDELLFDHSLPILARIPRLRRDQLRDFLTHRTPLPGEVREAFRTLRANLAVERGLPHTILVTSSISGEGKTLACANLAIAIAAGGERVLLIDGDFRNPMLPTLFGVPIRGSGVIDVMLGNASRDGFVSPAGYTHLRLLPSSPRDARFIDLVEPLHAELILEQLKHEADVIIIDSSPLTEVADALIWAGAVDTILVAARIGRSRRDKLDELLRTFGRRGVDPAGVVLTTRERPHNRPYYSTAPEFGKLQAKTPPVLADGSSENRAASGEIEPG